MTPSISAMTWIVAGQAIYSLLRSARTKQRAFGQSSRMREISLNSASLVVRGTVVAGIAVAIMGSDWRGVIAAAACSAIGSILGDWIAMRKGGAPYA